MPDRPIERRHRILVVDDEEIYRETLRVGLEQEGFSVTVASNGHEALDLYNRTSPDLVLLDLTLPDRPGVELCQEMRSVTPVPIIVVSARRSELDVVLALELGVCDYVEKPFRLRELIARIRAVLRRQTSDHITTHQGADPSTHHGRAPDDISPIDSSNDAYRHGAIALDKSRREVRVNGETIDLSRKEFDLLALLMSQPGRVLTREFCIEHLWWDRDLADTRTLDTHIRRLRHKIERDASKPCHLITVRGVGFRFEP